MLWQKKVLGKCCVCKCSNFLEHSAPWSIRGSVGSCRRESCFARSMQHFPNFCVHETLWGLGHLPTFILFMHKYLLSTYYVLCSEGAEQVWSLMPGNSQHRSLLWGFSLRKRIRAGGGCRALDGHPPPHSCLPVDRGMPPHMDSPPWPSQGCPCCPLVALWCPHGLPLGVPVRLRGGRR